MLELDSLFEDDSLVSVPKSLLVKAYACMATGSYVPSMFFDVREIMVGLNNSFGAPDEKETTTD